MPKPASNQKKLSPIKAAGSPKKVISMKKKNHSPGSTNTNKKKYEMQVDIHKTLLEGVYALLFYKPKDIEEAAWTVYHRNKLAVGEEGETLQDETGIFDYGPRKAHGNVDKGPDGARKTLSGSKWDWECFLALKGENETDQIFGKQIAREFTRFSKKEARLGGSNPNTFILRNTFSINPKSLNYYIIDDAVVKKLHCLYHQYSKEEIM